MKLPLIWISIMLFENTASKEEFAAFVYKVKPLNISHQVVFSEHPNYWKRFIFHRIL